MCLSNVLLLAFPAFDQVDHVFCLAGSCSTYVEGLVGGCDPKGGACLDVAAGEAASGATRTASTGWLESSWLELCFDQEVPKVLWSSVGYQGPFGDGFFRRLEACSTRRLFFSRAVKLGRLRWYVTTSGILLLQRVLVHGVRTF